MPIIDSHCHAWSYWPYAPDVPDPEHRGRVEQLLHEMDAHGIDQAVVVCAQIDHNPDNNAYVADRVAAYPERLHQVADLDSAWSTTYHTPGAGARLREMAERWPIKGFTHYLAHDDDGAWLGSEDGVALFTAAADLGLFASLSCYPHQQKAIRAVAERFPTVPVLCHHLGHPTADEAPPYEDLSEILVSARCPNVYLKLSGFYYATGGSDEYPFAAAHWLVRALYDRYGAQRLCWGSDYPVARLHMTYLQALDAFREHCDFVPDEEKTLILGGNVQRLLAPPVSA